jgi:hypothetical protein
VGNAVVKSRSAELTEKADKGRTLCTEWLLKFMQKTFRSSWPRRGFARLRYASFKYQELVRPHEAFSN